MHTEPMPGSSGVTLTRKGERYCDNYLKSADNPSLDQETRAAIEAEVERLIEILDELDLADEDLEANGDELDASYTEDHTARFAGGAPEEDEEGSLGWTGGMVQLGGNWQGDDGAQFWSADCEADNSDYEDGGDD